MTDPISDDRLAEVRERFAAIANSEPGSLTGDVKALLSRLDKAEAGWQVKPLEWRETPGGKYMRAVGAGRTYEVRAGGLVTVKKAAAQADYEACIRSALIPSDKPASYLSTRVFDGVRYLSDEESARARARVHLPPTPSSES